jgi:predicted TPR repeat methyltransferase
MVARPFHAPSQTRTSGDLLADRRYAYADAAFRDGDVQAAVDLAQQALDLAPAFAPAYALLGRAEAARGDETAAIAGLTRALALEPDDALGVRIDLARLGATPPETALGAGYVRALFDGYARDFDRHLVGELNYRAPELIRGALRQVCAARGREFRFDRALDLGCGTGLMGQALRGVCAAIEGVDLSPRMLAEAAKTGAYRALHERALLPFLQAAPEGGADLVVAADVFVYVSDLAPVFAAAHRALGAGGLFAFTVQAHAGDGVALGEDARYAHGEPTLRRLAAATGFTTALFEPASTREDRGADVPGFLMALAKNKPTTRA